MDAGERDRHERVPERAHSDGAGAKLALASRDAQAARGRPERDDPLLFARLAEPDEEPRWTDVEPTERPELDLERALDAAYFRGVLAPLDSRHEEGL